MACSTHEILNMCSMREWESEKVSERERGREWESDGGDIMECKGALRCERRCCVILSWNISLSLSLSLSLSHTHSSFHLLWDQFMTLKNFSLALDRIKIISHTVQTGQILYNILNLFYFIMLKKSSWPSKYYMFLLELWIWGQAT